MEDDRKELLLKTATKLFSDKGFKNVSIREIANECGLNSAMISYYYGGKENLYTAVLARQAESITDFINKDTSTMSPEAILTRYVEVMGKIHEEHPDLGKLIIQAFSGSIPLDSEFGKRINGLFQLLTQTLKRGIAEGTFRKDLKVKEAIILLAGMTNFHFLSRDFRQHFPMAAGYDEKIYLKQALQIFLAGISTRSPRR